MNPNSPSSIFPVTCTRCTSGHAHARYTADPKSVLKKKWSGPWTGPRAVGPWTGQWAAGAAGREVGPEPWNLL